MVVTLVNAVSGNDKGHLWDTLEDKPASALLNVEFFSVSATRLARSKTENSPPSLV